MGLHNMVVVIKVISFKFGVTNYVRHATTHAKIGGSRKWSCVG